ncbi:MAG: protein-L-isoaspartate(D-aspartate) O-methyltransferase [Desulfobacteraceae bacterium]|nr:protein-L-isoaspartate(D-aspartate) O-methyltransferase [Desulfobacteraceae bacterium]
MKIAVILKISLFILTLLFLFASLTHPEALDQYTRGRRDMVSFQIRDRGVFDPEVIRAMETVPRHEFVPGSEKEHAYEDRPLPVGYGQTISQPYIVALMTGLLKVGRDSKVLEIGTGSGYQAAVLAEIVREVYTVEIVPQLYERAGRVLAGLKYGNVRTLNADGYFGWAEHGPYDAVIVTCAVDFIPPPLIEQLALGGRMCVPVGPPFKVQHLVLVKKEKTGIETEVIASVRFVPLVRKGD